MTSLFLARPPAGLRVLDDRTPRGGTVEMPIATPASEVVVAKTSGGGKGTIAVTPEMFAEIVANFPRRSGPTPVYFGHIPEDERRTEPAAAFVERVWVEGDQLWGVVDLTPDAWDRVVNRRGFRGFSVEMRRNLETPTAVLDGWALTGGAITNTPALDVQYVAAGAAPSHDPPAGAGKKGSHMAENTEHIALLTALQDQVNTLAADARSTRERAQAETAALSAKLDAATQSIQVRDAQLAEARKKADATEAKLAAIQAEKSDLERSALTAKVRRVVRLALESGVEPRYFDGCDKDPAAWLEANFASLEALERHALALPKDKARARTATPAGDDDQVVALSADQQKLWKKLGINTKYFGVRTSEDLDSPMFGRGV